MYLEEGDQVVIMSITIEDMTAYFKFLDDLRESAKTNMLGGASFLRDQHPELSRQHSGEVLGQWMETFGTGDILERVKRALSVS